jgi:hypothetical protein
LNGGTKATEIHIKNDTRMVIIVPLDISSNYLVIKNMREALPGGFNHSLDVEDS